MRTSACVVFAVMLCVGCKKDGQLAEKAATPASAETSAAIDSLVAAVPGEAMAIAFVDMATPPWEYITGGVGIVLDADTRKTLDKELREYITKYVGVDVSKLQYAVGFVGGPPPSGAVLLKTVSGTPTLGGSTDFEGGKVWVVEPREGISLAIKGDTVVVGKDAAVRAVLETLAGKRKSVTTENPALVEHLRKETKGAAFGAAAIAPKGIPLPPQIAGLQRVAVSLSRTQVRAVVDGDEATITRLQGMADQAIAESLAQVERAHAQAIAGDIPPPQGAFAIIGAAYAKSYATKLKPRREGNRLVAVLDLGAPGQEAMMGVGVVGVLAAVAVPAFMDYTKKAKVTEAALQLNKIGKNLKVYYITNSAFPTGDAALSPTASCCAGPGAKCPVSPDAWQQPAWQALDFQIDEPNLFQYRYHSDGATALVEAVGDLDCDGQTITYRLDIAAPGGNPSMTITEPAPNTD